jgi:hypothetical protein
VHDGGKGAPRPGQKSIPTASAPWKAATVTPILQPVRSHTDRRRGEILGGKRTIISYLLDPVIRLFDEGLREP